MISYKTSCSSGCLLHQLGGCSAKLRLVNLCGRGDKDMLHVAKARGVAIDTEAGQNFPNT